MLFNVLQCAAVYCNVLQRVAVCCSVLQRVAACYSVLQRVAGGLFIATRSTLWLQAFVALSCTVLQRVAVSKVCCIVLQCVAACCGVLQMGSL